MRRVEVHGGADHRGALKEHAAGTPAKERCRRLGVGVAEALPSPPLDKKSLGDTPRPLYGAAPLHPLDTIRLSLDGEMNRTPLGRAVQTAAGDSQTAPSHAEDHGGGNSLRDVILGGQDGLVNMLGIALGVVSAGGSTHVLIAAGLAASFTESISMGAVAYTSFGSVRDFYMAQRRREQEETDPNLMSSARRSAISMRRKDSRASSSKM